MSRTVTWAPEKPREGQPCNGCGFCCAAEPCGLAQEFLGVAVGPCPAMQIEDGRFWCGLIRSPSAYLSTPAFGDDLLGAMFAERLGAGRGCDADDVEFAGRLALQQAPDAPHDGAVGDGTP